MLSGLAAAQAHPRFDDLTGKRFGRWIVVRYIPKAERETPHGQWLCRCDCGHEKGVLGAHLRAGYTQGCVACFNASRRVADAERICRWCRRKTERAPKRWGKRGSKGTARECQSCNRTAQPGRYGRHVCCGAPAYRRRYHKCEGGEFVAYVCRQCEKPLGPNRRRSKRPGNHCSERCQAEETKARDRTRARAQDGPQRIADVLGGSGR